MERSEFKKKGLQAAKEKQERVIEDLQETIDRRKASVENEDIDMHNYWESTRDEGLEYVEQLSHQKEIARSGLDFLNRLRIEKEHEIKDVF